MKEFRSFLAFAEHLIAMNAVGHVVEHEALEKACVEIEKRAKEKIGEYQRQAGPFAAWAPLTEDTKARREKAGFTADDPLLVTGDMRDSIEHKVIGREGHIGSDSDIALYQELGTSKIPARSFLGGSAFELGPKISDEIGLEFFAFLSGGRTRIAVK